MHTLIARLLAKWWKVGLGKGCSFDGIPIFRRLPGSSIRAGNDCKFLSTSRAIFAGINHPCILATLMENAAIAIGDGCGFSGVSIGAASSVVIGNRVMAGANSSISDTDWDPLDPERRAAGGHGAAPPVRIGDDVSLGASVIVPKGVTIGSGTIVAANSVVSTSLPSGVIAAGTPARPVTNLAGVRNRGEEDMKDSYWALVLNISPCCVSWFDKRVCRNVGRIREITEVACCWPWAIIRRAGQHRNV